MISVSLIDRCLLKKDHDRLLRELARNGLVMPLGLQARLSQAPIAVTALGLRRLTELTYGPTPQALRFTQQLLDAQRADGHFNPQAPPHLVQDAPGVSPLATAAAIAALHRVAQDLPDTNQRRELENACRLAVEALAESQCDDGLFAEPADQTHEDRLLTSAFIMYLLTTDARFQELVDRTALATHFARPSPQTHPETLQLWAMAQLTDAPIGGRTCYAWTYSQTETAAMSLPLAG
ncbi:MAG: hypothetical protein AAGI68_10915 [Planctomycetota bacterium]